MRLHKMYAKTKKFCVTEVIYTLGDLYSVKLIFLYKVKGYSSKGLKLKYLKTRISTLSVYFINVQTNIMNLTSTHINFILFYLWKSIFIKIVKV